MRKRRITHSEGDVAGIDLAPMLDFVLNLLIFFIVIAVFVKEVGLTVSRPNNNKNPQQEKKKAELIAIGIFANDVIRINGRNIDVRAVRANVERLRAEKPDAAVVIFADKGSETGVLMMVMDQVRQGGVQNVSLAAAGGG